jgi:drug/metabolite transporter (DMT)-like permease
LTDRPREDGKALAVLVAGACAIAFAPVFVRLSGTGPAAAGFWRLSLALPVLALMAARASGGGRGGGLNPTAITLAAGAFFGLDLTFWHYGIHFTTVANATILANLSPVFVTAGAWLLLRERPARMFVAGLALALAGTWAIAAARGGGAALDPPLGDALSIATSVWYAAYLLCVRRAREAQSAPAVMAWSSAVGAVVTLLVALGLREQLVPASAGGWLACAALGLVHVTGQGAIAWALGKVPAAVASVVVLAQPVLTAVLGWLIFAEPMTPLQMLGGALALGGVAVAQLAAARARRL